MAARAPPTHLGFTPKVCVGQEASASLHPWGSVRNRLLQEVLPDALIQKRKWVMLLTGRCGFSGVFVPCLGSGQGSGRSPCGHYLLVATWLCRSGSGDGGTDASFPPQTLPSHETEGALTPVIVLPCLVGPIHGCSAWVQEQGLPPVRSWHQVICSFVYSWVHRRHPEGQSNRTVVS